MPSADSFENVSPAINPYASPVATTERNPQPSTGGIWSDGKVLVMHKQANLPDVCIKSNQPTDGYRLKRKLTWHHPAVIAAVLISPLVYIILAVILSKKATLQIGLSEVWRKKRGTRIAIAWGCFLLGVLMIVAAVVVGNSRNGSGGIVAACVISGLLLILGGAIYGLLAARMVYPQKIDDEYVYLKGAHPDFIARFPPVG